MLDLLELDSSNESLVFYLAAFMYHKDTKINLSQLCPPEFSMEKAEAIVEELHSLRSIYTHEKMIKFTNVPDLARLFLKFSESGFIPDKESQSRAFEEIKTLCSCTLNMS